MQEHIVVVARCKKLYTLMEVFQPGLEYWFHFQKIKIRFFDET